MIYWNQPGRVYPQSKGIAGFFIRLAKNVFTLPIGDCYCTASGKQAAITGAGYFATITGSGYQVTITGANG